MDCEDIQYINGTMIVEKPKLFSAVVVISSYSPSTLSLLRQNWYLPFFSLSLSSLCVQNKGFHNVCWRGIQSETTKGPWMWDILGNPGRTDVAQNLTIFLRLVKQLSVTILNTGAYLTQSAMGVTSEPCCMRAPIVNQKELRMLYCKQKEQGQYWVHTYWHSLWTVSKTGFVWEPGLCTVSSTDLVWLI